MAAKPDLSEFEALNSPRRPKCSIRCAFEQLSPEDAAKLEAALAEERFTHSSIAQWLTSRGFKVLDQTVGRHRAGKCSCG